MEEPKSVVIVGRNSSKLAEELQNYFSPDEYGIFAFKQDQPTTPTVVILLTQSRRRRLCKKVDELAARGCKTLTICTNNQSWELVVDKASGFLEGIL